MIEQLPLVAKAIVFLAALFGLLKGADFLVDTISTLADRLGVPKLIVGLTVVAFGTSAPEFAVSSYAAWSGSGSIALSNVVGSNIFNTGIILGLCAIFGTVQATNTLVYRDMGTLLFAGCAMSYAAVSGSGISRFEGLVLASLLAAYLLLLFREVRRGGSVESLEIEGLEEVGKGPEKTEAKASTARLALTALGGLAALLFCSRIMVLLASHVARDLGVSEWMIGVTVVAVGTSLPELITTLMSFRNQQQDIGVGALIGSDIMNILGVIGLAAMLSPIQVDASSFTSLLGMIVALLLTFVCLKVSSFSSSLRGWLLLVFASTRYIIEITQA